MPPSATLRRRVSRAALVLAFILVGARGPLSAGEPPKKDVQFWTPTVFRTGLSGRWSLQVETQVKLVAEVHELQNSLLRPSVMIKVGKNTIVHLGYAWVPYFYPARADEHRAWQQLVTVVKAGRWILAPRVRFEQRFLPVIHQVSLRLRGQFKAMLPLTREGGWQLAVSDELFFNLNDADPAPLRGFAGSRTQIGFTRRLSRNLSVEPGYLFQYVNRSSPLKDEVDHVVMFTTVVSF